MYDSGHAAHVQNAKHESNLRKTDSKQTTIILNTLVERPNDFKSIIRPALDLPPLNTIRNTVYIGTR